MHAVHVQQSHLCCPVELPFTVLRHSAGSSKVLALLLLCRPTKQTSKPFWPSMHLAVLCMCFWPNSQPLLAEAFYQWHSACCTMRAVFDTAQHHETPKTGFSATMQSAYFECHGCVSNSRMLPTVGRALAAPEKFDSGRKQHGSHAQCCQK